MVKLKKKLRYFIMLYIALPFILALLMILAYFWLNFYFCLILLFLLLLVLIIYYLSIWSRTQIFGYFPDHIKTKNKIIALSFDDGPNPPDTKYLLEILNKHQVKATFFIPGDNLLKYPELAKEIMNSGHIIGNHSQSHKFWHNFIYCSWKKEIVKSQQTFIKVLGRKPALYRSPWLFKQPFLLRNLKKYGLTPISGYFGSQWEIWHASAQRIAKDALKIVRPGRIMIFHDGIDTRGGKRTGSVQAMDILIPALKEQGYQFLTVPELLGIDDYQNL